jgi:hypothetical protein
MSHPIHHRINHDNTYAIEKKEKYLSFTLHLLFVDMFSKENKSTFFFSNDEEDYK